MDAPRFDSWVRTITTPRGRRAVLRGLAAAALGASLASHLPESAAAKKKTKIKRNKFGCVNVGDTCKNAGQCCSGICAGKTGKKHCQAHNIDVCHVGQDSCDVEVPCTIPSGPDEGFCFTTTGNAPYCGASGGQCFECSKDKECIPFCGEHAACVRCPSCQGVEGAFITACIGLDQACTVP